MSHAAMRAKIHIAKKELRLQDEEYRALLQRVAGTDTSRNLSDRQATAVIAEFKRLGWEPRQSTRQPSDRGDLRKIYALWKAMHPGENDTESLRRWVRGRFGVSAPEFLKPGRAREAIEQLKAWQKRLRGEA